MFMKSDNLFQKSIVTNRFITGRVMRELGYNTSKYIHIQYLCDLITACEVRTSICHDHYFLSIIQNYGCVDTLDTLAFIINFVIIIKHF